MSLPPWLAPGAERSPGRWVTPHYRPRHSGDGEKVEAKTGPCRPSWPTTRSRTGQQAPGRALGRGTEPASVQGCLRDWGPLQAPSDPGWPWLDKRQKLCETVLESVGREALASHRACMRLSEVTARGAQPLLWARHPLPQSHALLPSGHPAEQPCPFCGPGHQGPESTCNPPRAPVWCLHPSVSTLPLLEEAGGESNQSQPRERERGGQERGRERETEGGRGGEKGREGGVRGAWPCDPEPAAGTLSPGGFLPGSPAPLPFPFPSLSVLNAAGKASALRGGFEKRLRALVSHVCPGKTRSQRTAFPGGRALRAGMSSGPSSSRPQAACQPQASGELPPTPTPASSGPPAGCLCQWNPTGRPQKQHSRHQGVGWRRGTHRSPEGCRGRRCGDGGDLPCGTPPVVG